MPLLQLDPSDIHRWSPPAPRVQLQVIQGGWPSAGVYRRRRVLAVVLLVVMVVALALSLRVAAAVLGGGPASAPEPRPPTAAATGAPVFGGQSLVAGGRYVVQPGDTLWELARAMQPSGDLDGLVDRLIRLNGGPELDVGERLILPG